MTVSTPQVRSEQRNGGLVGFVQRIPTASALTVLVGTLCVIGLVMVGSASSVASISLYGSPWAILARESIWMVLGVVVFVVVGRIEYSRWRKVAPLLLVVTFLMLIAVLVPGVGVSAMGSSRWIGIGQLQIQPSELMKLALALYGADLVVRRSEASKSYKTILGPLILITGFAGLLILLQPDMGTSVIVGCIAMGLLFGSGVPMRPVLKVIGSIVALAVVVAIISPYRRARLLSFINPGAHRSSSGYQVVQSVIGMGSGHITGVGLGSGREKWGYLPNAYTDFILSVIGEELGLIGALTVLVLLGALVWYGLRTAARAPDHYGSLLALTLVVWISAESIINIGAVVGVMPVTGIPLPFVSYGGSSLVIMMVAAGVLVYIARHEPGSHRELRARLVSEQRKSEPREWRKRRTGNGSHLVGGAPGMARLLQRHERSSSDGGSRSDSARRPRANRLDRSNRRVHRRRDG